MGRQLIRRASQFLVITGVSGAGKSTAVKTLEDLGYNTTDNMPLPLIKGFMEMRPEDAKTALVIDIRSGNPAKIADIISVLKDKYGAKVVFLTAADEVLIRRYKESRRTHPLGEEPAVAVAKEKQQLDDINSMADIIIDTSTLNVHELSKELATIFSNPDKERMLVTVKSFGFKHGIPTDSDLVFDVRFLRNPHFVEAMRDKTGLDAEVNAYVKADPLYDEFFGKLKDMVFFLIPQYIKEGKKFLVISIGCTGGHHRSVTVAEQLAGDIKGLDVSVNVRHKDIEK